MTMMLRLLCLTLIHFAAAADMDFHQQKGLEDTQKMLKSPQLRKEAIKKDKHAQEIDSKVDALAGSSKNKEEIYDLASQVMEKVTQEAGGDPEKMEKLLLEAQSNPQAFFEKYFSAEQKKRVRGVAQDIEKNGKGKSKP